MKVKLEKNYKSLYTLEDLDRAKAVIKAEADDLETAKGWAEYAAKEALKGEDDNLTEILKAEATTAGNCRIWDAYGDDTQSMDVWLDFTARTDRGFLVGGAYLSDIWQSGATDYKHHMFIRYFTEKRQ